MPRVAASAPAAPALSTPIEIWPSWVVVGVDAGSVSGGLLPLWGDLAGAHLVAQPIALPADLDDVGVVQQPIEHGRGERLVAGKGLGPLGSRPCEIQPAAATAGADRSLDGNSVTDMARSHCSAAEHKAKKIRPMRPRAIARSSQRRL